MSKAWPMVALSDVAKPVVRPIQVIPGQTYRTIGVKWWGEGAYERQTIDGAQTAAKVLSLVKKDDLIINKIWVRHGSTAVATEAVNGCAASNEFPTFRLDPEKTTPRWLHWLTKTRDFWAKCDHLSMGTSGKNRIKPERFLTIEIPLPPLEEQRRIVAKVETLAAKIEEATRLRQEIGAEATALLKAEMRRTFASNSSWQQVPLENVCAAIIDNLHSNPKYAEDGVPCIRSPDVGWGTLNLQSALKTSEKEFQHRTARGEPQLDDIVLVREGGGTGKAAIVAKGQRFSLGQRVMMIRPNKSAVLPQFFLYQLLSPVIYDEQIVPLSKGSASPHLNIGALRRFTFRLPELPIQERIVRHLDDLSARLGESRQHQAESAAEVGALLPAILDRAFKGEL
ncbi:MAG: restriction endonuclease subunit S [Gemmataceae bacterium]|nr:restriction endonuclease subunit S [Gemmataceae bacterium]MCI0738526.1 restriction endonuclease subunit S [Gemmataceae bacterium]